MITLMPELMILWLQTLFYPITNIILPSLIPSLKLRLDFERKNLSDKACQSFKLTNELASFCFEISSEGEFEQIAPLLLDLLDCGLKIELIYCSPSVEKRIERLSTHYTNLKSLRFPLLTYSMIPGVGQSLRKWVTAKTVILCRYDFFPELMIMVKKQKSFLFSASLIGKKKCPRYLKRYLKFFDEILVATKTDRERFHHELNIPQDKLNFLELRFIQIERRLSQKVKIFESKNASHLYSDWLQKRTVKKSIIGSMWPNEVDLFSEKMKNDIRAGLLHVTVFPHKLSGGDYDQLIDQLKVLLEDIPLFIIDEKSNLENLAENMVVLFTLKGMLCEFYSLFDYAYIGGGHGRSVHSLLEPYLAGPILFCGPKVFRSTEFMIVKDASPKEIVVVETLDHFYDIVKMIDIRVNLDIRFKLIQEMNQRYKEYFERFTKGK